jgi:hypothetical protein
MYWSHIFPYLVEYVSNAEYMVIIWSVGLNPLWLSLMIASEYQVNLARRMIDKFLYVVDNSDMPQ